MKKVCSVCKRKLDFSKFYKSSQSHDGVQSGCKECSRKAVKKHVAENPDFYKKYYAKNKTDEKFRYIFKKYKITRLDYKKLYMAAGGKCEICKIPSHQKLEIDHNHETGKIRGLLCGKCNRILGHANDNPIILKSAIDYIRLRG